MIIRTEEALPVQGTGGSIARTKGVSKLRLL